MARDVRDFFAIVKRMGGMSLVCQPHFERIVAALDIDSHQLGPEDEAKVSRYHATIRHR